jgi:hypothetical protein
MLKRLFNIGVWVLLFYYFQSCTFMADKNSLYTPNIYSGAYRELAIALNDQDLQKINLIVKRTHLNLNYTDSLHGLSLLNWCILNIKPKSFDELLVLGADPNWYDNKEKFPPSIIEASQKKGDYLISSIKYGGNPNCVFINTTGCHNHTPLLGAIFSTDIENVKLLVNHGADVNFQPNIYCNPLAIAMIQDEVEIAKYLVLNGADYKKATTVVEGGDTLGVLYLLREMAFPLNSKDYKLKMELVEIFATKGLDYWKYPIPENIKKEYEADSIYLSKY